jgi:FkbM family methyltransferase
MLDRILADRRRGPKTVVLRVPTGGEVHVHGWTGIVRAAIAQGQFEAAELALMTSSCAPGTVAFDVGANVGLFTVAFAQAVGPSGRVIAVEPYPPSIANLSENVRRNGLDNVVVITKAVGASSGSGRIIMSDDPALIRIEETSESDASSVDMTTLDAIWIELGRPIVSVVKIDVEGSEATVLRGAAQLLATGPVLMVETHDAEFRETVELLRASGYERQPTQLEPWNHVFRSVRAAGAVRAQDARSSDRDDPDG